MRRLKIGAIILSAALIMGCSSNNSSQAEYDSLMAEKQSLESELQKQKETTEQETTVKKTEVNTTEITTEQQTTTVTETTTEEQTTSAQPETTSVEVNAVDEVEILAEYTLADGIGWYTMHFMVIRNNTGKTLDISTNSKAYTSDGSLVSVAESYFDALPAGCTSVVYEAFETDAEISYYDTKLNFSKSDWYKPIIQDLSYEETIIKDGVIYEVTNNGNYVGDFIEGYALFFLGDILVGYDSNYFTDDDNELKAGDSISKQFKSYNEFDRVEFYLEGTRD